MKVMPLKQSFRTGLGFGLTSGVTTTLGLVVSLNSGTHSEIVVLEHLVIAILVIIATHYVGELVANIGRGK